MNNRILILTAAVVCLAGVSLPPSVGAADVGPSDLPRNSISIEAEHYDYEGGKAVDTVSAMPYTGSEYEGKTGAQDVDYHRNGPNGSSTLYRKGETPDVPMADNLGGQYGKQRPGFEVQVNYRIGWIGDGEWYNYTRTVPAGYYRAYAALSYGGGTAEGAMRSKLGLVTSGAGTTTQTVDPLGDFIGAGSGTWGRNNLVPLSTNGLDALIQLPGGMTTLRFTTTSAADYDWFVLAPVNASPEPADLLIRSGTGAFAGNNIYDLVPSAEQTVANTAPANLPARFEVKVENDGTVVRSLVVRAQESSETGWTVGYIVGTSNVTAQITSAAGYRTGDLAPAASEVITVEMIPNARVFGGTTKTSTLSVYPLNAVTDSVRAVAAKAVINQPDLVIRREGDATDLGKHLYNATAAGQTRLAEVQTAKSATYLVQLLNDGNTIEPFKLTATAGGAGWDVKYLRGRRGMAFNGAGDYVNCGNWGPGTNWTVEAWVRLASVPGGRHGMAGAFAEGRDWGIALLDGKLAAIYKVGAGVFADIPVNPNVWYHLAGTCDGSKVRVFVDGVENNAIDLGGVYDGTGAGVWIAGEVCCGENRFPGVVADVRLWNRALAASEIQADMQQPLAGDEPGLLGYWPLDDGYGTIARDLGPFAHHGTVVGSPAWGSFADPLDLIDVTAAMTSASGVELTLAPHIQWPLVVQVTPTETVSGGAAKELIVQAQSEQDPGKADAVAMITTVAKAASYPEGGTYTLNADFQKGRLMGVGYDIVPDELQLTKESVTLLYLWVPNSNEGTVSKIDTRTGRELGRYRTSPKTGIDEANPSRTTVDLYGNCWVGNRQAGTAVKIGLLENGQYVDRNGNGIIDTSRDLDGDGNISGSEILPWGADECVLYEVCLVPGQEKTYVPGTPGVPYVNDLWNPGPRGFGADAKGNVWVGTYGSRTFYYISGATGEILKKIDLSSVNHTSYGALIIAEGALWSAAQDKNHVLRLDPTDDSFRTIAVPHLAYGINVDKQNHLFVSGWQNSKLSRIDTRTGTLEWTHEGIYESRGVAVTDDGDVWVANSAPGTVARWSNDGVLKTQIPVGATPTGVAVDADGKVWVVNYGDEYVKRINPDTDSIDLAKRIVGGLHYGYSDMTGILARQNTTRIGSWSVVHNAKVANAPWDRGQISWTSTEHAGTSIKVRARTCNDQVNWSFWRDVPNGATGARLIGLIPGKFIEVEAFLQSDVPTVSPVLQDLTITPGTDFILGELVYFNNFETPPGPEWSDAKTDVTPVGQYKFLGQFQNETVKLTLDKLAQHVAVNVAFDLYVIGRWDGNDTTQGPDIFDVRLEDGLVLMSATFNNGAPDTILAGQAYPDGYPGGQHPAFTGAREINSLGFTVPGFGAMDSVYRLQFSFAHTASFLKLVLQAKMGAAVGPGAAWGLDNVQINVTPLEQPPQLLSLGFGGDGRFQMRLLSDPQRSYAIDSSDDLRNWTPIATNIVGTIQFDYAAPGTQSLQHRFYRARRL